jgi:hypothetical protein
LSFETRGNTQYYANFLAEPLPFLLSLPSWEDENSRTRKAGEKQSEKNKSEEVVLSLVLKKWNFLWFIPTPIC